VARSTSGRSHSSDGRGVLLVSWGAAAITAWLAAPSVATQVDQLASALPGALERATEPLERFSWWTIGKLLSMAVIGIATWVGLVLLKIPLASG
jgi:predicted PurR-regulated permease PerM